MKKQYLLLILLFLGIKLNAQNCNFTYVTTPGSTLVDFIPNSAFSPNLYHYVWDFGDGTTSTVSTPAHAYNSVLPIVACCSYYDSLNVLICTACDTIFLHSTSNCSFTYQNTGGNSFVFQAQGVTGGLISWDFGDNSTGIGSTITHVYTNTGQMSVLMTVTDTMTSTILCVSTQNITVGTSSNCSFTATSTPAAPTTFVFAAVVSPNSFTTWDFGDGNTGTGNSITHTFNIPGIYTVCMTSVDFFGVSCTFCQLIQVGSSSNCFYTYSPAPNTINGIDFTSSTPFPNTPLEWDFGDGSVGTGNTITHIFAQPGSYFVCVTQRDTIGQIVCTFCDTIVVGGTNNCFFSFAPDPNTTNGFIFAGSPAYNTSTIAWDFGDGSVGTGLTATHSYGSPGAYTVCMNEIDVNGIIICSTCNTVFVSNTGNCSFTYSANTSSPLTIDFQANGGILSTVTWDFGDGSIDTGFSVQHTYSVPGVYQVCIYVVTNPGAISCTYCDMVMVGSAGPCAITYYSDPFNPNTYIFNSAVNSATSAIQWTFGDGTAGSGQSVTHAYNSPGTYNVCITEWDLLQNIVCQSCTTITVSGVGPANCQASFLGVANGLDAYFIDMSVVNANPVIYSWDFGDNTTSSLQFPQHTYAAPGAYTVCLDINTGSCNDSYCSTIIVDTINNNPGSGCNAFYATVQLAPFQVSIVNLSSGLNLTFDWDYGDGSPHDSNPYPSHYYTSTGSYNLCLTVSDGNGCTSTYCDTLNVDTLGSIFRTSSPGFTINVFSPQQLVGVKEIAAQKSFRAYPNPVTSELHVSILSGNDKAKEFRILSYQGAEILSGILNGIEGNINTQSLSSGTYLLEITLTDGSRSFQSIIKQ